MKILFGLFLQGPSCFFYKVSYLAAKSKSKDFLEGYFLKKNVPGMTSLWKDFLQFQQAIPHLKFTELGNGGCV